MARGRHTYLSPLGVNSSEFTHLSKDPFAYLYFMELKHFVTGHIVMIHFHFGTTVAFFI